MSHLLHTNLHRAIIRRFAFAIALLSSQLTVSRITAEEPFPEPAPKVKTYELELTPSAESNPTFKYRLYNGPEDRTPGNAAVHYHRAIVANIQTNPSNPAQHFSNTDWFDVTIDRLPVNEVQKLLDRKSVVLDELRMATSCDRCDWGVRFQDLRGMDVLSVRLAEFQETRDLARVLRLKARLAIAQKRFDDATDAIRQQYQLSQDIAYVPSVICSLIAIAIRSTACDSVIELISAPNSPNLYWPLRTIPDSFEGILESARFESSMAQRVFPFLKDAETSNRTAEEWKRLLTDVVVSLDESPFAATKGSMQSQLQVSLMLMNAYPVAKRELEAAGFDHDRLEQMPIGQVVAIYVRDCNLHVANEFTKVTLIPFAQGNAKSQTVLKELIHDGYMGYGSNVASWRDPLLLSNRLTAAGPQILQASNRQRFMKSILITLEAIRLHMAANHGQLPRSLDEITIVPVPSDPSTGKPFLYRVVDQAAELLVPPSQPDEYAGRRFLLTPRK